MKNHKRDNYIGLNNLRKMHDDTNESDEYI